MPFSCVVAAGAGRLQTSEAAVDGSKFEIKIDSIQIAYLHISAVELSVVVDSIGLHFATESE